MQSIQLYPGYAHIIELISERILAKQYLVDERIPSVREMAMQLEVNPITVTRAYERLQRAEIIYTQRGLGYFVREGAPERIREERLKRFYGETIPTLEREMKILGITTEEIIHHLNRDQQRPAP